MVYTEQALVEKLNRMNGTELSIQTLSYWIICDSHKKHYVQSVKIWEKELYRAKKEKKLIFLYLANDILQTSRKKGSEFIKEFAKIIKPAVVHVYREGDTQTQKSILKTLNVWVERKVYPSEFIEDVKTSLNTSTAKTKETTSSIPPFNSSASINSPLVELMRKVESGDIANDLMEEKLAALNPTLLSNELPLQYLNNVDPMQFVSELEDAHSFLSQYYKQLEEDINRRQILFQSLMDYAEKQEAIIQKHKTNLQEISAKLSQVEKTKSEIQPHLDSTQHEMYSPQTASPSSETNVETEEHISKRPKVDDSSDTLQQPSVVSAYGTNWMNVPLPGFPPMFPLPGFPNQPLPYPIDGQGFTNPNATQFQNWTVPNANFKTT